MAHSVKTSVQHVRDAWDGARALGLTPLERLVYRSNCLGGDQRITNTGGGNTSSKLLEADPLTEERVEVLWVKGSGGDLRTATRENFASLYQDRLLALQSMYDRTPNKGLKSEAEDAMVACYAHCTFDLNPRASSIDTPLHAFIPARHVDHMHPNAVISIAAAERSRELTRDVFGDEIGFVPWMRPGFELGLAMQEMCRRNPELKGLVMGRHGLINWADDDEECYRLTLRLIETAAEYIEAHDKGELTFGGRKYDGLKDLEREGLLGEILPWLRGRLSIERRVIATIQADEHVLRFINSVDAPRLAELGTSCPDHFLRTKIKPLFIEWNPHEESLDALKSRLDSGLERYRNAYREYYERCKRPESPPMRDPNPRIVLIPGLGMIAFGRNKSESRVTAEFYTCAIEVMRGAEAIDEYTSLPMQEAFDIEYWALEEAKLCRMPPEKPLERRVVLVIGAGNGIGRAAALHLANEGAHVVCADLDAERAGTIAEEIIAQRGEGVGVAGTGISGCGPAVGLQVDVTDRDSVRSLLRDAVLAYGGVDHIVITAGVYVSPDRDGAFDVAAWRRTFDVNVMGSWIVSEEARRVWQAQGLRGSLVLTTSVNGVVPKKGSLAYDASKAAANHLVRELAIELAPIVRVNAVAPATVVDGSTMFPRDRVIASLCKYGIEFEGNEPEDALRERLADFYAQRTLTGSKITPDDQARAICFLVGDESAKTTGQIIAVDGGLHEGFMR